MLPVLLFFVQLRCPTMRWLRPPTGMRLLVRAAKALRRRHNAGVGLHRGKNEMSTERNRSLQVRSECDGAASAAIISLSADCAVASQLRSSLQFPSGTFVVGKLGQSASLRAQLRSSLTEFQSGNFAVVSLLAAQRRSAVRSVSASCASRSTCLRSTSLPNKALVPTANRHAPFGSRSQSAAPAAQRGRYNEARGALTS